MPTLVPGPPLPTAYELAHLALEIKHTSNDFISAPDASDFFDRALDFWQKAHDYLEEQVHIFHKEQQH